MRAIIDKNPSYGGRLTAVARKQSTEPINRKSVHRIGKETSWQVRRRLRGQRPRAQGWRSGAATPSERWAVDATHDFCCRNGWCHSTAIIDCLDRTIVGWRLSKTGISHVAAATLEGALRSRRIARGGSGLTLRSANGLVFGTKPCFAVARRWGVEQEYIVPYTPEQNGMIERFFESLKAECVWLHHFTDRDHAFRVIADWMGPYDQE